MTEQRGRSKSFAPDKNKKPDADKKGGQDKKGGTSKKETDRAADDKKGDKGKGK
ncbi:stress-induced protein [Edaphovirga cremea]|uniref:stress-induced protein n=1 Tax=Edaphovirga cremea TaxID=2267246 RepID=UPI000DEEEB67|nr:stress-induced protein [Edaphovirga cremea]